MHKSEHRGLCQSDLSLVCRPRLLASGLIINNVEDLSFFLLSKTRKDCAYDAAVCFADFGLLDLGYCLNGYS